MGGRNVDEAQRQPRGYGHDSFTPVHLLIHTITQSANHVAAAQYIKSHKYSTRASVNVISNIRAGKCDLGDAETLYSSVQFQWTPAHSVIYKPQLIWHQWPRHWATAITSSPFWCEMWTLTEANEQVFLIKWLTRVYVKTKKRGYLYGGIKV